MVDESADSEFAILFLFLFLRLRKLEGLSIDKKQWKDGDDFSFFHSRDERKMVWNQSMVSLLLKNE